MDKIRIDVDQWAGRASSAFKYWERRIEETDGVVKMYRDSGSTYGDMSPVVNKVWEYAQSVLPQIFYQAPYAYLTPIRPGEKKKVRTLEKVLNWTVRQIPLSKHGRRVVLEGLLRGWGISKAGYLPPAASYMMTPLGEEVVKKNKPLASPGEPMDLNGRAIFRHVPIKDFALDPDAVDLEDARWCVHRTRESLEEIKARYDNVPKDLQLPEREITRMGEDLDEALLEEPSDLKFVEIYEIWIRDCDGHQNVLLTCMQGHDKPLRKQRWPYREWPFSILTFNQDPELKSPGMSDVKPWAGLQTTLNGYLKREIDFVKNIRVVYLYDSDLPKETVQELAQGEDLVLIPCDVEKFDSSKIDLRHRVVPVPLAELPAEFWNSKAAVEAFIHQISGYVPFGDREAKAAGSATESNILARSASLRIDDRLANGVAVWMEDVFKKLIMIIRDYYDEGSVPVLKNGGLKEFIEFKQEDIDVDSMVRVDFGTIGRMTSDEQRKRERLILLTQLFPVLNNPMGVTPAVRELVLRVLDAHHEPDSETMLPAQSPATNPHHENVLLGLGHAVLPTPMDDHDLHELIHSSAEEAARASGNVDWAERIAAHRQMHMQLRQPQPEQGGMDSLPSPGAGNADGFGSAVATPTSTDQTMGVNLPGGMG